MAEKQIMVKIDHVSKEYRLGAIGGTTLREDLERFRAKIRKKEDGLEKSTLLFRTVKDHLAQERQTS